ncbi:MAG TPA: hypothetical protein VK116_15555 [Planctomycetota bacterium]|nr:hypothetical protein [Planctomycetota bacterium]
MTGSSACSRFERAWDAYTPAAAPQMTVASEEYATVDETGEADEGALTGKVDPSVGVDPSGRWAGRWLSLASGHTGELRAIITPVDDSTWDAWFRASWGPFFSFEYRLPLEVEAPPSEGGILRFRSEADLGWLWGRYSQSGEFTGERLYSTYESKHDHGTFELERVPDSTAQAADE